MKSAALLLLALSLTACTSGTVAISRPPLDSHERLGRTEGSACGTMGLLWTAYNFFPIMLNSRVERAYEDALLKKPGATGLVDVSIEESWFWWVIGTTRCVTIAGEAVK